MNTKNKLLWMILFVLIAGATIWTLTSQNRSFSFAAFRALSAGNEFGLAGGRGRFRLWLHLL